MATRQNLTLQLNRATIAKAKLLAAVRETSISKLVSELIEVLIKDDDRYLEASRLAQRLLKKGFHLKSSKRIPRDELHER